MCKACEILCTTSQHIAVHGHPSSCARATLRLRVSEDSATHPLPLQMEAAANEAIKQAARLVQERQQAASDADGRIKELQGHLQRLQAQESGFWVCCTPDGLCLRLQGCSKHAAHIVWQ